MHGKEHMSETVKKIGIDDLSPGMFLQDVFDKTGRMLYSANAMVSAATQVEMLKLRGVTHVFINTDKGADLAQLSETTPRIPQRERAYYDEIGAATAVYKETLEHVRTSLKNIRQSKSFDPKDLEDSAQEIVESIARNPDALVSLSQLKGYDEYTYVHSVNVGILTSSLAREMGYSEEDTLQIAIGGLVHDIGKMRVPESILNKPGRFTDWEFAVMKKHPELGLEIVKDQKRSLSNVALSIIAEHHERYNGNGYPKGITGTNIREAGLMGAVADVYDALTTDRVYRAAWLPQKALAFIFKGADEDYSRTIVERFTKYMGIYPVGSFVRLASGEMGVVTRVGRGHLLSPIVLILFDRQGHRKERPDEYDLHEKQKGTDGKSYAIEISLNPKLYRVHVADFVLPQDLSFT